MLFVKIMVSLIAVGGPAFAIFKFTHDAPSWVKAMCVTAAVATAIGAIVALPEAFNALEQTIVKVGGYFVPSAEELRRRAQEEADRQATTDRQRAAEEARQEAARQAEAKRMEEERRKAAERALAATREKAAREQADYEAQLRKLQNEERLREERRRQAELERQQFIESARCGTTGVGEYICCPRGQMPGLRLCVGGEICSYKSICRPVTQ